MKFWRKHKTIAYSCMTGVFLLILTSIYWPFYLHKYNPTLYFYIHFVFLVSPTRLWATRMLSYQKQKLFTLREHISSASVFSSFYFLWCVLFCLSSFCVLCPMVLACPFGFIWRIFIKLWYRCFIYKHVCWSCILFFNGEYTTNVDSQKDLTRPVRVGICIFLLNKR